MSSAPTLPRPARRVSPGAGLALTALTALLVFGTWAWVAHARWSMPARGLGDHAPETLAGPPAAQPMQQPEPPATLAPARLAMPWVARGYSDLAPSLKHPATAIEVAQGFAYIGSGTVLQVVDVRDTSAPRLLGRSTAADRPGAVFYAQDIVVSGSTAYMISIDADAQANRVADNSVLLVFDVADPAAPRLVQDMGLREIAYTLFMQDGWLYVGGVRGESSRPAIAGLLAIQAQQSPLQRGHFVDTDLLPTDTARLDSQHMVLAGQVRTSSDKYRASLEEWRFEQPGRPAKLRGWVGPKNGPTWLTSVAVIRGRAYAVASDFGFSSIYVFDVSHGNAVDLVVELQIAGTEACIASFLAATGTVGVALGHCPPSDGSHLFTYSPQDDSVPGGHLTAAPVGSIEFRSGPMHGFLKPIAVENDLLFILGGEGRDIDTLRIVDISAPDAPVVVGRWR
ncbi:MAG TPA: hypothetical protein PK826_12195 [Anaerolineae bacterium]|nr:hypothetical protein [Anaerolineae bacterium]